MERPNLKCMSERKLERITYSLHTEWSRSTSPGVTSGRWKAWLPCYKSPTRTWPPPSVSPGFTEFLVRVCSLFCLRQSLSCCHGSLHTPPALSALQIAFTAEPPTAQVAQLLPNTPRLWRWCKMRGAIAMHPYYVSHIQTHPSACWKSHRTSKLQHYDKNTEKNLHTNLASLSEFCVPSRIRVNSIQDFFHLSFHKIMGYFQNATFDLSTGWFSSGLYPNLLKQFS